MKRKYSYYSDYNEAYLEEEYDRGFRDGRLAALREAVEFKKSQDQIDDTKQYDVMVKLRRHLRMYLDSLPEVEEEKLTFDIVKGSDNATFSINFNGIDLSSQNYKIYKFLKAIQITIDNFMDKQDCSGTWDFGEIRLRHPVKYSFYLRNLDGSIRRPCFIEVSLERRHGSDTMFALNLFMYRE